MNPPRDHPSSRGRRSQSQRVPEAVDDVPRRWRPRAPRTGGPGARRSAEKRLRRKRFGYAEAQICTHSRTQATVTRRNRGRSTKSRRRLTPQRGAHAARTLTPFCPLGPKVKFCFHSATYDGACSQNAVAVIVIALIILYGQDFRPGSLTV